MNFRPVGKKAEPTTEELEFIYSRMDRLSDQEVLEEMQDTEFPLRSLGFIKRRRREYNAAKRVLSEYAEHRVENDKELPERYWEITDKKLLEEHFHSLLLMAHELLERLKDIWHYRTNIGNATKLSNDGELVCSMLGNIIEGGCICWALDGELKDFWDEIKSWDILDSTTADFLLEHLRFRFPEITELRNWREINADNIDHSIIHRLQLLCDKQNFGICPTCPICQEIKVQ